MVGVRQSWQLEMVQGSLRDGDGTQPWVAKLENKGKGQVSHVIPLVEHCRQFWNPQTHAPLLILYGMAHLKQVMPFVEHCKQFGSWQVVF